MKQIKSNKLIVKTSLIPIQKNMDTNPIDFLNEITTIYIIRINNLLRLYFSFTWGNIFVNVLKSLYIL